jgi:hypothetical protein
MEDFKKKINQEIEKTLKVYNRFLESYRFSLALASLDKIKKLISDAKYNKRRIPKKLIFLIYDLEKKVTPNYFCSNIKYNKSYPFKISKPYLIIKKFNKN